MSTTIQPIIIIGTGLAGISLAKEIRKIDTQTPLVLITQDDGHFYSKPQLSTAIAQGKSAQQLIITDVASLRTQLDATIYVFSTVRAINTVSKTLTIEHKLGEDELRFSKLVFAMGAKPKPFPQLNTVENNYRINNLLDYGAFIEALDKSESLTIIGSGLVGCEFAYDFANKEKSIHVVTPDPYPLTNLVPAPIGMALQSCLAKLGVTWHTQSDIACVNFDCTSSLILTAIGLQPNIALAKQANIETRQGIVVDSYLKSSQENIFALGDCAQIEGVCRQFVAPILQSARALAQTLCGNPTPVVFPLMPITLKVSRYPIIVYPPKTTEGEWIFEQYPDGIKALFHDGHGDLQGYALSGSQSEHRQTCLKALSEALSV